MFIEILNDTVREILEKEGEKKNLINIELTPHIYNTLQRELNDICKFNTEVPIQEIIISEITLHERSVTIIRGDKLNSKFEAKLIEKTIELTFKKE